MKYGSAATRHREAQGGTRRQRGLWKGKRKRGRKEGGREGVMKKKEKRINKKIVCDGCIRKDAN